MVLVLLRFNEKIMNLDLFENALEQLQEKQQFRSIPKLQHQGKFIKIANNSTPLINISSNDYLGIGADRNLQEEFLTYIYQLPKSERIPFGSTSSRLLTGNHQQLELLENALQTSYQQANSQQTPLSALVFNSGYHANLGIIPAIAVLPRQQGDTLILADKLVHASIIDGIQLATVNRQCYYKRYRHNDYQHLRQIIAKSSANRIIIVTESIFSMDGDCVNLAELIAIKNTDKRIEIYLDEAHAVGVKGNLGLGLAEQNNCISDIDYLVGTFGKAFASMGAYLICPPMVRKWLINRMRTLIYSTALPPITHAWNYFILQKMGDFRAKRQYLTKISNQVRQAIEQKTGEKNPSQSPIIPYIVGSNKNALATAEQLQKAGFYALPIRPPTVPNNTARIRLVMNASLDKEICDKLCNFLA